MSKCRRYLPVDGFTDEKKIFYWSLTLNFKKLQEKKSGFEWNKYVHIQYEINEISQILQSIYFLMFSYLHNF